MVKNYFKVAWRNIRKNKIYSGINILGLSMGMAVALLIGLWVYHQYTYDRLPGYEKVYQVRRNFNSNGDTLNFTSVSLKLANVLRAQIPEIEYLAETDWLGDHGLVVGDKKFYTAGAQVGSDFLRIVKFPLKEGSLEQALKDPYSIVLTQSFAKALFGSTNAMNRTVRFDNVHDLKVTGILEDLPTNSSFRFKYLVPFSYNELTNAWVKNMRNGTYSGNAFKILIKLKDAVSVEQVASKIRNIEHTEKESKNAMNSFVVLQPMARWHLYSKYENGKDSSGFIEYVRLFSIIGIIVLLIACINFVNLATARSEKRAREVGVRKAIGSRHGQLIGQFLTESFLLTLIAFVFSVLIVYLVLPAFNALTGDIIHMPFSNPLFWLSLLVCLCITALAAGSRPAFYLSSFRPVQVLKGALHSGRTSSFPRKALVVLQFTCSIALIISTMIVYRQIQHAKERPTGFNENRLLVTSGNDDLLRNFTALKNELIQNDIAESVSGASSPATEVYWHTDIDQWPGKNAGETVEMGAININKDYLKTMGMRLLQGREFNNDADTVNVLFNEAAIQRLRLKEPVGQSITWGGQQFRIVGVVKDALMISPFAPPDPTMFFYSAQAESNILYRLSPHIKTEEALAKLTVIFNKYSPAYPYDYKFADASYAAKFSLEVLIGRLAGIFAALAIFISCLGLFGLAAYVAEKRTKEIGIRKVLGASIAQVWLLLCRDFILLVLISCMVASPLAFYFLQKWLMKYEYRIGIGPSAFLLAAAAAIAITLVTISFQAIRAAVANPVRSLRTE